MDKRTDMVNPVIPPYNFVAGGIMIAGDSEHIQ
jgi:hypothetical protein